MKPSAAVKVLLTSKGKKQLDLVDILGMSSRQSLNNKFSNERWSANDLAKVAEFTDSRLAFIMSDGQVLFIDNTEE